LDDTADAHCLGQLW